MRMKIELKKNIKDYLFNNLKIENEDIFFQLKLSEKKSLGAEFNFDIEEDLLDEIRDWALDKQQIMGFDKDYDLNNEGKILQEIIDKFYI